MLSIRIQRKQKEEEKSVKHEEEVQKEVNDEES
jgi:hypothetical protein